LNPNPFKKQKHFAAYLKSYVSHKANKKYYFSNNRENYTLYGVVRASGVLGP